MQVTVRRKEVKKIILLSARQIFSKKGFDGAGIAEIAKDAQVPKSLIYYHFNSKKDILNHLMNSLMDDYKKLITSVINDKDNALPRDIYLSFLEDNEDLVRIIIVESLKRSDEKPFIFNVVDSLMEFESPEDISSRKLIGEFFTNIIPAMMFTCFSSSWSDNYNVSIEQLKSEFKDVRDITHGAFHKAED